MFLRAARPVARPACLRRRIAVVALAVGSVAGLAAPQLAHADVERPPVLAAAYSSLTSTSITGYRTNIVSMTNTYRKSAGLPTVRVSSTLTNACQGHANDMARNNRMSHTGSDGSTYVQRAWRAGFRSTYVAENIAYGYKSSGDVMRAWMNSYTHRKNIMNRNFTWIGVGVQRASNGTLYYCMLLGRPN